jgi:hypothetical protein
MWHIAIARALKDSRVGFLVLRTLCGPTIINKGNPRMKNGESSCLGLASFGPQFMILGCELGYTLHEN